MQFKAAAEREINTKSLDFLYEGFDQASLGKMQAQWLTNYMKQNSDKKINIGYVAGDESQSAAVERYQGFKEDFLDKNTNSSNVKLIVKQSGQYKTAKAQSVVEDWMNSHPDINVIVCANDEMAIGAVNAVKAANRKDIMVLGCDGIDAAKNLIKGGSMTMTVAIDINKVAKGAVDTCVNLLTGQKVDKVVNMGTKNLTIIDKNTKE